jgi:Uma2 family endonuclease
MRYAVDMGTKAALSVEAYLHTSFPDLDKEYRDGEVVERSLPTFLHGKTQGLIAAFFVALRKTRSLYVCTETRMQLRPGLYLIPDVAVFYPDEPGEVPDFPPLIAIEILSPDDRLSAVRDKLEEYRAWGVAHVWLVDPYSRRMYTCDGVLNEVQALAVPEWGVEVKPSDLFE